MATKTTSKTRRQTYLDLVEKQRDAMEAAIDNGDFDEADRLHDVILTEMRAHKPTDVVENA